MGSGYYWLEQGFPQGGRWYLGDVCDDHGQLIDTSVFLRAVPLDLGPPVRLPLIGGGITELAGPARIRVARPGPALPLTLGTFDLPIVSGRLAELLDPLAGQDVQRIAAQVEGHAEPFELLNVIACPDCLDHDRSQIEWWEPPGAPAGVREPFAMYELVLTPGTVVSHGILRVADWKSAVLVSGGVKAVIEAAGGSGVRFTAVNV